MSTIALTTHSFLLPYTTDWTSARLRVEYDGGAVYEILVPSEDGTAFEDIMACIEVQQAIASDFILAFAYSGKGVVLATPSHPGEEAKVYALKGAYTLSDDYLVSSTQLDYAPHYVVPDLEDSVEAAQTFRDATASQLDTVNSDLASQIAVNDELRSTWDEQKDVLSKYNTAISSKESTIVDLEKEISPLTSEIDDLQERKQLFTNITVGSAVVGLGSLFF